VIKKCIKKVIKSFVPSSLLAKVSRQAPGIETRAAAKGFSVSPHESFVDVIRNDKVIRVSREHEIYLNDIFNSFDYYHSAVVPFSINGYYVVDYSGPRYHDVVGFDSWPVMFPSFAEPMVTTFQYLEFASLSSGGNVLDLGAYSGLTSMVFSRQVGASGVVVAVDADPINLQCIRRNIDRHNKFCASSVRIMDGAVWSDAKGLEFSCEGNMGGSATAIVGKNRGKVIKVQSFTLSDIAKINNLSSIDFIKCDIEGAESVVFEDKEFFEKFRPRIIVEPHQVGGRLSTDKVMADLSRYGYKCKCRIQSGVEVPLIECSP
jgi:FkbM family methyltransferase